MSVGTLAASFLGIYYQGKKLSHKLMEQLEMVRIFNAISAFNKFGNTKYVIKKEPESDGAYLENKLLKIK